MPITITKPEVAKILNPTHETGEVEALYKIATLLASKINAETTSLSSQVEGLSEEISNLQIVSTFAKAGLWSDALAAKLNLDAGVTDTDYEGVDLGQPEI